MNIKAFALPWRVSINRYLRTTLPFLLFCEKKERKKRRWSYFRYLAKYRESLFKVLLTRTLTDFVASVSAVVDDVANLVQRDAMAVVALKFASPAGKDRRRH